MANTARLMSLRIISTNKAFLRPSLSESVTIIRCGVAKGEFNNNSSDVILNKSKKSSMVSPMKAVSVSMETKTVVAQVPRALHFFILMVKKALKLIDSLKKISLQMFIEKTIINCRFFTLIAVAGSLLGSVLCFVEGCFIIVQSYIQYFHTLSHKIGQGHVMHLLIEAIDMFLVGTAMLIFGVGLYSMFVGSKSLKDKGTWLAGSNLFGLFYMKRLPKWIEMHSISHAKSKLGHAVMMILQVGVLEKFNSVPMVSGTDLACFAGTIVISSACIFLLSKLSLSEAKSISTTVQS